jgi:Bacterial Ig domain
MKKSILGLTVAALLASSVVTSCKKKDEAVSPNNKAPYVLMRYPASNDLVFYTSSDVYIDALASDADGSISKVEFYDGSKLIGTETKGNVPKYAKIASDTLSYSMSMNFTAGSHTITAKAYDNANANTTSTAVTITVRDAVEVVAVSNARK